MVHGSESDEFVKSKYKIAQNKGDFRLKLNSFRREGKWFDADLTNLAVQVSPLGKRLEPEVGRVLKTSI